MLLALEDSLSTDCWCRLFVCTEQLIKEILVFRNWCDHVLILGDILYTGSLDVPSSAMELDLAKAGMHMLVEKPISMRPAEEVERLAQVKMLSLSWCFVPIPELLNSHCKGTDLEHSTFTICTKISARWPHFRSPRLPTG